MIDDGFTKFDNSEGRTLDDVIQNAVEAISEDASEETWAVVLKAVKDAAAGVIPTEIADHYVGRISIGDNAWYPRRGTLRVLYATRQVLFMDDLYSPDEDEPGKPVYITLRFDAIDAFTWYPNEEEATEAVVLPMAA